MNRYIWKEKNAARQAELYSAPRRQFGLTTIQELQGRCSKTLLKELIDSSVWATQHHATISAAVDANQTFNVLVGFKPSRFHIGHITLAREVSRLLHLGGVPVFIVAGYEAGQVLSQHEAEDKVKEFWSILNSLQRTNVPLPTEIFCDRLCTELRLLEDRCSEVITVNKLSRLYGWDSMTTMSTMRVPCMSAAAFLLPHYIHPDRHTVALSDIKQVTHSEVTKIVSRALDLSPPMFSYHSLLPALTGPDDRMSCKKPKSVIFLNEQAGDIARKLKHCFSGGRETTELQREKGGNPDRCSFFRIAETLLPEEQTGNMLQGCISGSALCDECKREFSPQLIDTLTTLSSRV